MQKKRIALVFAVVVLATATTVGFACEGAAGAESKCAYQANSEKIAKLTDLAVKAEGGCEHSTAALIAMAKESGCKETAELAAKAEGGCEKSTAALIAQVKECSAHAKSEEPSIAMLAAHAEQGCDKSKAALIAKFKESGCDESKALAAKAEGGCDKSMDKLIAMAKETDKKEAKTE